MPESLLSCTGIDIQVGNVTVARGLDLDIQAGQCWCLLGRNGIGKTTLLHTLAGLRAPAAGNIQLNSTSLTQLKRRDIARQLGILFRITKTVFLQPYSKRCCRGVIRICTAGNGKLPRITG